MPDDERPLDPATRTEGEAETLDMPEGFQPFTPGQVLGERYQILEMLGRGGMGEVWQAFDLKLRVEVALKALREDFFKSERRLELLRQEVRAAREVMSPNVCRIFDLIEIEGRELVSMEYVDGATLLGVLQERGPLDLKEAQDIASQFLAGLEAIHKVGLIHRDIKPENIMLTRAGRVVVMDFGLARQDTEGGGSVSGTPAYMAPEQAAGQALDPRADVYSAGVVLAEMVSPEGIKSFESRQSVWEGVRSEPAKVPDSPWAPVLKRAVAKDREGRYNTARTLTRALEDVTLRVEGAEDLHPYPGLASFTKDDAEYFFGREAEIEQMWRKLEGPPRMLALVGPSGAGKSSFLGAGLIPGATASWTNVVCTPGTNPELALSRALAAELAGDAEAIDLLLRFDDPEVAMEVVTRWRRRSDHALLIVDQFEELFTQNAPDKQRRVADLLSRLVLEADVHVLLSMRDDFFFHCHQFDAFAPLQDGMTLIGPPVGGALRGALVRPATKCGFRFEDDALVEEMLAEVEGERGALPLLAFAAAQLWEQRDRETGHLTREAYRDIGGVAGALARHAEATIDRIGVERLPIVRELFRNLVTAEGTRAVREWGDLLSVFDTGGVSREGINPSPTKKGAPVGAGYIPAHEAAKDVLRELIDARLLTSYEIREEDKTPTRRVEIIHESLLANWPRLVRWQTQDADASQLRDQLRQAASTWNEKGRSDDTLWTGSAYREFASWRERYPGGLTGVEDAFSSAMIVLAGRRQRRRRMAVAILLVIAAAVATVTTALWRRSVLHERRAEAQKLIALGTVRLGDYPTEALAHATRSLELADSEEARFLALRALWQGPTAFVVNQHATSTAQFSPSGSWLVQSPLFARTGLRLLSRDGPQRAIEHQSPDGGSTVSAFFGERDDLFVSLGHEGDKGLVTLWSAPEARLLASAKPVEEPEGYLPAGVGITAEPRTPRVLFAFKKGNLVSVHTLRPDGSHEEVGSLKMSKPADQGLAVCVPRASAEWIGVVEGGDVSIVRVTDDGLSEPLLLGRHEGGLYRFCDPDPLGRYLVTISWSSEIKLWDVSGERKPASTIGPPDLYNSSFSSDGSLFYLASTPDRKVADLWVWSVDDFELRLQRRVEGIKIGSVDFDPAGNWLSLNGPLPTSRLWSLAWPAGAQPIVLRHGPVNQIGSAPSFSSDGRWLATADASGLILWPLGHSYPAVLDLDFAGGTDGLAFGPDGRYLTVAAARTVALFPLEGPIPAASRTLLEIGRRGGLNDGVVSPNGELFAATTGSKIWVGRVDGGEPRKLDIGTLRLAFTPDGRHLALNGGRLLAVDDVFADPGAPTSEEEPPVETVTDGEYSLYFSFAEDGRLLTGNRDGVKAWDVETGDHETLVERDSSVFAASADGQRLLVLDAASEGGLTQDPLWPPSFFDLDTGVTTTLTTHGLRVWSVALNREGTVAVTADRNGIVRVGPVTGEEPHLLLGHDECDVTQVVVDPTDRWIASKAQDGTVRLWPMPDISKPPLHTLPHDELIAKLHTLTNLRVVRDDESSTGWKLTHEPLQGWETVPTW